MGNEISKAKESNAEAYLWLRQYEKQGRPDYLDKAIRKFRKAVEIAPLEDPKRGEYLMDLGTWLGARYEISEDLTDTEDIREAVSMCEEAISLTPPGHEDRVIRLITLGDQLVCRYKKDDTSRDLDEATRLYREAISLAPLGHMYRMRSLISLADLLAIKFKKTKALEDINEAIQCCEKAVEAVQADDSMLRCLNSLAVHRLVKYEITEEIEDLNEGIRAARQAVEREASVSDPISDQVASILYLSQGLALKFEKDKKLADIDEAISLSKKALAKSQTNENWVQSTELLGNQLSARLWETQDLEDADKAIQYYRQVIKGLRIDGPERLRPMIVLCQLLREKCAITGEVEPLTEAIRFGQESLKSKNLDDEDQARVLSALANCFALKFDKSGDEKDIEEAIRYGEAAVLGAPDDRRRAEMEEELAKLRSKKRNIASV